MAEKEEFWSLLLRSSRGDAVVLLATFLLTVFVDLITRIGVGVVLGALLFLHRMAESVEIAGGQSSLEDVADDSDTRSHYDAQQATNIISAARSSLALPHACWVFSNAWERPRDFWYSISRTCH
jgi:MFS superfamily sulfate permease-like transporter